MIRLCSGHFLLEQCKLKALLKGRKALQFWLHRGFNHQPPRSQSCTLATRHRAPRSQSCTLATRHRAPKLEEEQRPFHCRLATGWLFWSITESPVWNSYWSVVRVGSGVVPSEACFLTDYANVPYAASLRFLICGKRRRVTMATHQLFTGPGNAEPRVALCHRLTGVRSASPSPVGGLVRKLSLCTPKGMQWQKGIMILCRCTLCGGASALRKYIMELLPLPGGPILHIIWHLKQLRPDLLEPFSTRRTHNISTEWPWYRVCINHRSCH